MCHYRYILLWPTPTFDLLVLMADLRVENIWLFLFAVGKYHFTKPLPTPYSWSPLRHHTTIYIRYKDYWSFCTGEAIQNASGLGLHFVDGKPRWDLTKNVNIYEIEVSFWFTFLFLFLALIVFGRGDSKFTVLRANNDHSFTSFVYCLVASKTYLTYLTASIGQIRVILSKGIFAANCY